MKRDNTPTSEATATDDFDPITFSVILNRLNATAEEMTLTLERSAWTSLLALCRDFSCAVYDAVPRQIAMVDAIPIHTTSLHLVLGEITDLFEGDINDGDVFICNSAFHKNTHIGDLVTACPVFVDGVHLMWSVTRGHQMDTGAFEASSVTAAARNIWQEGLQIPPLRLVSGGEMRQDVLRMYLANMRMPESLEGDLIAQLGSIEKGRIRLLELFEEYGCEVVMRYVDEIVDYADRRTSEEIRKMPDGVYHGEGWVDSDGVEAVDIPIKVKVTIEGESVKVDYDGSGKQAEGGLNSSWACTQAAGAIPFMYYIDPDIPHNHGCIGHVEVTAPKGTICNPNYPASTCAATVVPSDLMQDVINRAMVEVLPERVPAGTCRCANVPQLAGYDENGEPWGAMLFNNCGGQGATASSDGWPLFESQAIAGGLKAQSVEQLELLYPLRVVELEIEPDSMGLGTHIGGPGVRMNLNPLVSEIEVFTFGDGASNPPHGAVGGTAAIGGGQYVEDSEGKRRYISSSGQVMVGTDEYYVGISTGGGGHGNPLDRDIETVRRDIRDGIITRESGAEVYGLIVTDDFDPQIDEAATAAKRAELAKVERPPVTPTEPNAATWLEGHMREGDEYLFNPA